MKRLGISQAGGNDLLQITSLKSDSYEASGVDPLPIISS